MTTRTFIFCDVCNESGFRDIELRRGSAQDSGCRERSSGRRLNDGRAWFEGSAKNATDNGWHINENGIDICERCYERFGQRASESK